jgi:hypothetical protein
LVEIDALAAVMLGITAEELCAIYRTQFGVLRKYERVMRHDANGRQVPKDVPKEYEKHGSRAELGHYELQFTPVDREAEVTVAHEEFTRASAAVREVARGASSELSTRVLAKAKALQYRSDIRRQPVVADLPGHSYAPGGMPWQGRPGAYVHDTSTPVLGHALTRWRSSWVRRCLRG